MRPLVILAAVLVTGCAGEQTPLTPAGDQAHALHQLLLLMLAVCGAIYLLVVAGMAGAIWRARGAPPVPGDAAAQDRRLSRGIRVTVVIIVAGLTVLIVGSFLADRTLFATRAEEAMIVRVTGHQWWWRVEYQEPGGTRWIETANELHLPLGRTTRVLLGSGDVLHSFWIPNVAGKIDMIPGRRNQLDLTPRREGWFRGQCTEFCGTQHAHMAFDVKVESPRAFDAWLVAQRRAASVAPSTGDRGAAIFAQSCAACHAVRGTTAVGRAGPDLTHVAARRSIAAGTLPMTRGGLQAWISQPQALKPGTSMPTIPLAPADADAVTRYLAGLR